MIPYDVRVYMASHPDKVQVDDGLRVVTMPLNMKREPVDVKLKHGGVLYRYVNGYGVDTSCICKGSKEFFVGSRDEEDEMIGAWNRLSDKDVGVCRMSVSELDSFLEQLVFDGSVFKDMDEEIVLEDNKGFYDAYRFGIQSTLLSLGYDSRWILSEVLRRLDFYVEESRVNRFKGLDDPKIEDFLENFVEIRYEDD